MNPDLHLIFYTELIRTFVGFSLLIPELIRLRSSIKQKITLSMIGILIFYNLIFSTRAIGIWYENSSFRQFAPALSALLSAIFLITWGALVISMERGKYQMTIVSITIGIMGFIVGASIDNVYLSIIGIFLFGVTMIVMISKMFFFVFQQSPYLQARYRIFLMTIATLIMIIFEGLGVIAMRQGDTHTAIVLFMFEIVGRIIMTLSIFLPSKVRSILSLIIK